MEPNAVQDHVIFILATGTLGHPSFTLLGLVL